MSTYRQGNGVIKRFTATQPTARTDGAVLLPSEIDHYIRFVEFNGVLETMDVFPIAETDASTPQDIIFDEPINVDLIPPGDYTYWYRTVDVNGLESLDSPTVTMTVLAPLAPPQPPTSIV